jgi:hypothetical protein
MMASGAWGQGAGSVTIEDFYKNTEAMKNLRGLGTVILSLRNPATVGESTQNLKNNYWAFKADAGLTAAQLALEEAHFRGNVGDLIRDVCEYRIEELKFAGLDFVCLGDCMDWYFAAYTPKGPVLIKLRLQFGDIARLFGFTVIKDWDEVKKASQAIQLKAGPTVVTIKLKPTAEPGKAKPGA